MYIKSSQNYDILCKFIAILRELRMQNNNLSRSIRPSVFQLPKNIFATLTAEQHKVNNFINRRVHLSTLLGKQSLFVPMCMWWSHFIETEYISQLIFNISFQQWPPKYAPYPIYLYVLYLKIQRCHKTGLIQFKKNDGSMLCCNFSYKKSRQIYM